MKYRIITAFVILLIACFILYYRFDIIEQMYEGRPWSQLEVFKLLLPTVLLVIGIFLLIKKNDNENL